MRIDAISLAHLCRSDARDFPCAHGKKDCGPIGGELEGITVSTGNENGSAPLFFRGGSGGQKIIRLEARRLCILQGSARRRQILVGGLVEDHAHCPTIWSDTS